MRSINDEELLQIVKRERNLFTKGDPKILDALVLLCIERGIYPKETIAGNPNSVISMVENFGAYWHRWSEPLTCKHCSADLRNHISGPPFKREIFHKIIVPKSTVVRCPDCHEEI